MEINSVTVQPAVANDLNSDSSKPMTTATQQNDSHRQVYPAIDRQKLQKVVNQWNQNAEKKSQEVRLAIHDETDRVIVEVVDVTTKKVISTLPPQQILNLDDALEREWKLLDKKI
jgi:flagellar protein FlaG